MKGKIQERICNSDQRCQIGSSCSLAKIMPHCIMMIYTLVPYSDASLAPSVTLLAPHFKSIFQLAVAYIGVLHKILYNITYSLSLQEGKSSFPSIFINGCQGYVSGALLRDNLFQIKILFIQKLFNFNKIC